MTAIKFYTFCSVVTGSKVQYPVMIPMAGTVLSHDGHLIRVEHKSKVYYCTSVNFHMDPKEAMTTFNALVEASLTAKVPKVKK